MLTRQLDGLHRCQPDLGRWSRASARFASKGNVDRTFDCQSGSQRCPGSRRLLRCSRLREALPSICSQQTFLPEQLVLISHINSLANEIRQPMKLEYCSQHQSSSALNCWQTSLILMISMLSTKERAEQHLSFLHTMCRVLSPSLTTDLTAVQQLTQQFRTTDRRKV